MDFEIVELEEFSGDMAHVYTILPKGSDTTLLEDFYADNETGNEEELSEISNILYLVGHEFGCRDTFFKPNEGAPGDGVVALRVGQMRLYCLRIGRVAVILGSGGFKPPEIRAYQEDKHLKAKAEQMKAYAKVINQKIRERDIVIGFDGTLTINDWEGE